MVSCIRSYRDIQKGGRKNLDVNPARVSPPVAQLKIGENLWVIFTIMSIVGGGGILRKFGSKFLETILFGS